VDVSQLKKAPREKVDGVLLIDKPVGPSSQQIVGTLKRVFNADKVGHGGTLDPLASGLLIIGFGEATKFLQRHLDGDKRYLATLRFGVQTSTGDAEGEIIAQTDARPSREAFEVACERFVGEIEQLPPQYSALKIAGKPAYAYARAGEHAPLQSRRVRINSITLKNWTSEYAEIDVGCGKGTYIRTLVEDIAKAAGSLASLTGLRRLASGTLSLENGVQLEDLSQKSDAERLGSLMPPEVLLRGEPCLYLRRDEILALASGKRIQNEHTPGQYVVMDNNTFCGLAVSDGRSLRVLRWLST
jgi:tRNA pseudouridine55 synthase